MQGRGARACFRVGIRTAVQVPAIFGVGIIAGGSGAGEHYLPNGRRASDVPIEGLAPNRGRGEIAARVGIGAPSGIGAVIRAVRIGAAAATG